MSDTFTPTSSAGRTPVSMALSSHAAYALLALSAVGFDALGRLLNLRVIGNIRRNRDGLGTQRLHFARGGL